MIYILTGVSGCGKTTIGKLLAERLGIMHLDADAYHPESNVSKMRSGEPLTDEDRKPWLESIANDLISITEKGQDAVLGCSALKHTYRALLDSTGCSIQWICLCGSEHIIESRMQQRSNHFFDASLLKSQLETIEFPIDGWHIDVSPTPETVVNHIISRIEHAATRSEIGIIGMGVMGQNLALNCADNGIKISVYNRRVEGVEEDVALNFATRHSEFQGIRPFEQIIPFIASLRSPRVILLMISAGPAIDAVIAQIVGFLQPGDLIIDGGNSHYRDTERRINDLASKGIKYIGMGISGGEKGARFGPSIMPGATLESLSPISAILNKIAARDAHDIPCWTPIAHGGAGHFVKMIHNGIEYAEMQLIADAYTLLKFNNDITPDEVADIFEEWTGQGLGSYLLDITIDICRKQFNNKAALDLIADITSHKGTGKWSIQSALDLSVPANSIASAMMARQMSSMKSIRTEMGKLYDRETTRAAPLGTTDIQHAFAAGRILNHIVGFEIMRSAAKEYEWHLDFSEIARIWTNGCIIRSELMQTLSQVLKQAPESHLLLNTSIYEALHNSLPALNRMAAASFTHRLSTPAMVSCAMYFSAISEAQSSANVVAAQRDYFGAHGFFSSDTFERDHFDWEA